MGGHGFMRPICMTTDLGKDAVLVVMGDWVPFIRTARHVVLAGAWRLELQTYGFGDRRSTN